jgi:hypothetical protein
MSKRGKRARRMSIDMNILSDCALAKIQEALEWDLNNSQERGVKLQLLLEIYSVKAIRWENDINKFNG